MFNSFFNQHPVTIDEIRGLLCRAVCRDEDDDTSEDLVRALVKVLEATQDIHDDEEVDSEWEGIEGEGEGYRLYYEAYFQELHGRDPVESDYGDLCPPDHVQIPGVPRAAVQSAGRMSAQEARALYQHYAAHN